MTTHDEEDTPTTTTHHPPTSSSAHPPTTAPADVKVPTTQPGNCRPAPDITAATTVADSGRRLDRASKQKHRGSPNDSRHSPRDRMHEIHEHGGETEAAGAPGGAEQQQQGGVGDACTCGAVGLFECSGCGVQPYCSAGTRPVVPLHSQDMHDAQPGGWGRNGVVGVYVCVHI